MRTTPPCETFANSSSSPNRSQEPVEIAPMPTTPRAAPGGNVSGLMPRLTELLEREDYAAARRVLIDLLAISPNDPDLLEVQSFLESIAPSPVPAASSAASRSPASPAREEAIRIFVGHGSPVNTVSFTRSAGHALSGSGGDVGPTGSPDGDCSVRAWDVNTGEELRCCEGHSSVVTSVAYSPRGHEFISASQSGTLCLWDIEKGKVLHVLQRHREPIRAVAYSPKGDRVLTGDDSSAIWVWDVANRRRQTRWSGHTQPVTSVAYFPSGTHAVSGSLDKTVRIWPTDGTLPLRLQGHTGAVNCVAVSPDGKLIASASDDGTIRLWDTATAQEVQQLEGHAGAVKCVAFCKPGRRLLSAGADQTVRFWDAVTGEMRTCFRGHTGEVRSVAASPDGLWALSGSTDKTMRLWKLPS